MLTIRKSDDRGHTRIDWLDSRHSFSFGDYIDRDNMSFRSLRVINDDIIEGGRGFGMHPHRDMEIVSYIVEGALRHKDSMGNGSVIRPGDIQRMTAGTGVLHSEFNDLEAEQTRLLQIWIEPDRDGYRPGYEEIHFEDVERRGKLRLMVSRDGRDGSAKINQDAEVYSAILGNGEKVEHELRTGRHGWVQVVRGSLDVNGTKLEHGDAVSTSDESKLTITATADEAELLLFDLA